MHPYHSMHNRILIPTLLAILPLYADVLIGPGVGNGGFVSSSANSNGSPDGWTAANGVWIDSGNSSLNSLPFGADLAADSRFIQIHNNGGETLTSNADFTVQPGDVIQLSLDYKTGGSGTNTTLTVSLWDSSSNAVYATLGTLNTATTQSSFLKSDFTHTAATGNTHLRLRFTLTAGGKDIHIDRVHLSGGILTQPEPPAPIEYATVQQLLAEDTDERIIEKAAKLLPQPRQVAWQQLETTFFIHYGPNAFTGREWGTGTESPSVFNPTALDARQWVDEIHSAGGKMVMLVVKHHDGFCLWPSRYTNHDVASSPWLGGNGDLARQVADACAARGIAFGVYLSPADLYQIESSPGFGSGLYGNGSAAQASVIPTDPAGFSTSPGTGRTPPAGFPALNATVDDYNRYFLNQLYELLTEYGPIAEVWFDGATPKQTNPPQQYDRQAWYTLIRTLRPDAVIAVKGPDCRWVGNESGTARETEWSTLPIPNSPETHTWSDMTAIDLGSRAKLTRGSYLTWYPAETDVPILHGWFWAAGKSVRTPTELINIYYTSVGRNSNLLLNLSPDNRGLIPDNQLTPLRSMSQVIRQTFATNLATGSTASADSADASHPASGCVDQNSETWWEPASGNSTPSLVIDLPQTRQFDHIVLQEAISTRGQRIESLAVDSWDGNTWLQQATATTVGYKRILRLSNPVSSNRLRVRILQSRLEPSLAEVSLHLGVTLIEPPVIGSRDAAGNVTLTAGSGLAIRYTLDGKEPGMDSPLCSGSIALPLGGTIRAIAISGNSSSFPVAKEFSGPAPIGWQILSTDSEDGPAHPASHAIDDNPATFWHTSSSSPSAHPHQLTIDMGTARWIRGFSYLPRPDGGEGTVKVHRFETSMDGVSWTERSTGEFDNIRNNPVIQTIAFNEAVKARYFRFTSLEEINGENHASAAEITVLPGGFEGWKRDQGEQSMLPGDPFGNAGRTALESYIFGTAGGLKSSSTPASGAFVLTLVTRDQLADINLRFQFSTNLLAWADLDQFTLLSQQTLPGGFSSNEWTLVVPANPHGGFARASFTLQ